MPPRERIWVDSKDVGHPAARPGTIATSLAIAALLVGACQPDPGERDGAEDLGAELDNAGFRDRVVEFVRDVTTDDPGLSCTLPLSAAQPFTVAVSMYDRGAVVGRGLAAGTELCEALEEATRRALAASGPDGSRVTRARFVVELIDHDYALVEYEGKGVELVRGLVPVRALDRAMVRRRIDEGKAYLLRVMDPALGGVHKYYHAPTDSFDDRLHTIYTASTLYTLLAVHAHDRDESLREPIARAAGFLLSMQRVAPDQPGHGAFHYSLDLRRLEREPRFVVGTTSKSIFTLIELHALTGDRAYLDAARLAADWLLTMQGDDGRVSSELRLDSNHTWSVSGRESMLYTGQVLSALSRLYEATADARYLDAAARTAGRLTAKVEREGCYVGDDYRSPNPISSSWVILSLFDFARASEDPAIRQTVWGCADELLTRQIDDPDDVYRHGRWQASLSSSGNGWLAEVLSELYLDCPDSDPDDCAGFRGAVVRLFRLLMQYTYSPENSFVARNPDMARGGVFWSARDRYVRTDSVCHAMNAYVFMVDHLPDGVLVELPEPPLAERLGLEERSGRLAGDEDEEVDDALEEDDEPAL
ncbi:terpene cyclase [Nannocystis punicea]|uniref:Terpene cyclase n=1 Tax=Nannocystis punicea TaxID=2995304 RepID=A0ABY7HJZ6_9BACT|nr:terpene cyclase [Nannocystis poenicansa]WAS99259.1 terpene cyclase [Nannocystis poenicansa]